MVDIVMFLCIFFFFFQAEDGIRDRNVTGVQTCALPICMTASLDYLGENVASTSDAQRSRDEYLAIFETIAQENLQANVSCKLTQLGLDINCEFCTGLVLSIVERAASFDNFLRIDMEGSAYTQRTIDLVKRVRARNPAVGTVIQSYLYRSEKDVGELL